MSQAKFAQERYVLKLAQPLLKKLYGEFEVDPSQSDRPDAAIWVCRPRKQVESTGRAFSVGIEITTVDKEEPLAYINGAHALTHSEIESSIDIVIPKTYVYDGVLKKQNKYKEYAEGNTFKEIILVCFSQVLRISDPFFKQCVAGWSAYLLTKAAFPFEKVVFVDMKEGTAVQVYDSQRPIWQPPTAECATQVVRGVTDFYHFVDTRQR